MNTQTADETEVERSKAYMIEVLCSNGYGGTVTIEPGKGVVAVVQHAGLSTVVWDYSEMLAAQQRRLSEGVAGSRGMGNRDAEDIEADKYFEDLHRQLTTQLLVTKCDVASIVQPLNSGKHPFASCLDRLAGGKIRNVGEDLDYILWVSQTSDRKSCDEGLLVIVGAYESAIHECGWQYLLGMDCGIQHER